MHSYFIDNVVRNAILEFRRIERKMGVILQCKLSMHNE